jgi:hypothetical protein
VAGFGARTPDPTRCHFVCPAVCSFVSLSHIHTRSLPSPKQLALRGWGQTPPLRGWETCLLPEGPIVLEKGFQSVGK